MTCASDFKTGLSKGAVIAWAPYNRRSQLLAKQLGADLHLVHYFEYQSPRYAPVKYPLQMIKTLHLLWRTRPQVVVAQNPPFLCGLAVYLYSLTRPVRYILDWHSAAFGRAWSWAAPMQRFLARRAAVNLVTNEHWRSRIASWGAPARILIDIPAEFKPTPSYPVHGGFNVVMIHTFSPDEPLETVLEVARTCADVHFYITGDSRRKPASFYEGLPSNVTFTGFISDTDYIGLLRSVDAIMALTTRDHTMQRGGCEAVWLGQPLIISDWPLLREAFHRGTIHVPNTVEGIRAGIERAKEQKHILAAEMIQLQQERQLLWDEFVQCFQQLETGAENPFQEKLDQRHVDLHSLKG